MSKFKKQYLVTVEGDAAHAPFGWGTQSHEITWLQENAEAFAEAVESFYQTPIVNRRTRVEPVNLMVPTAKEVAS